MGLLRKLFWIALFAAFTFSFIILFEYGTEDYFKKYSERAKTEFAALQEFAGPSKAKKSDGTR